MKTQHSARNTFRVLNGLDSKKGKVPEEFELQVQRSNCLGGAKKHMAGGAITGSLIHALERYTERRVITVSTHFVSAPTANDEVIIKIAIHQQGRSITQASAQMEGNGKLLASVSATLGERSALIEHQWLAAPLVEPPKECERCDFIREDAEDQHAFLDVRSAIVNNDSGQVCFWFRSSEVQPEFQTPFLAVICDYLPETQQLVTKQPLGGTSLDNSLRVVSHEWSDWILCEMQLSALKNGLFHGAVTAWTQSGTLLACGSQSGVSLTLG